LLSFRASNVRLDEDGSAIDAGLALDCGGAENWEVLLSVLRDSRSAVPFPSIMAVALYGPYGFSPILATSCV
jgi:hypothetical protein